MKKVLAILSVVILLSACKKDQPIDQTATDSQKNPLLISVSINGSTSEIVRVK